jgi:hypothetical protein
MDAAIKNIVLINAATPIITGTTRIYSIKTEKSIGYYMPINSSYWNLLSTKERNIPSEFFMRRGFNLNFIRIPEFQKQVKPSFTVMIMAIFEYKRIAI